MPSQAFNKAEPGSFANDAEVAQWSIEVAQAMESNGHPEVWDGDLSRREFQLCCFMVASSVIGADQNRLSSMFHTDPQLVATWAENLRRNGLWLPDGTVVSDPWFDPYSGEFGFTADCLVADGLLERHTRPGEEPLYGLNPGRAPHDLN